MSGFDVNLIPNLHAVPFVSPAMGYLGGLPPLLIIASDAEVLRDEIVYVYV
jgi:acetyl esterase/lipase